MQAQGRLSYCGHPVWKNGPPHTYLHRLYAFNLTSIRWFTDHPSDNDHQTLCKAHCSQEYNVLDTPTATLSNLARRKVPVARVVTQKVLPPQFLDKEKRYSSTIH
jgi:hypothetical protein